MNTNLSSGKFGLGSLASYWRVTAKLPARHRHSQGTIFCSPPPSAIFAGSKANSFLQLQMIPLT
jgi:hypothetical protein